MRYVTYALKTLALVALGFALCAVGAASMYAANLCPLPSMVMFCAFGLCFGGLLCVTFAPVLAWSRWDVAP